MRQEQTRTVKAPRPPKQPKVEDFQFYPTRLFELLEQEVYAYRNQINYKVPRDPQKDAWTDEDEETRKAEQEKVDVAVPLSTEEVEEKEELLQQGFSNWSKRDFQQYIKACERHGREAVDLVSKEVDSKTPQEVQEYHDVFCARFTDITNHEQLIAQIVKGEEKIHRRQEIQAALTAKVCQLC